MLLAVALMLLGTSFLCFSMKRHLQQLLPHWPFSQRRARIVRASGYACLALSITLICANEGTAIGLVYSLGWFSVVSLSIALWLSFREKMKPAHNKDRM